MFVGLVLAACAAPPGRAAPECDASWTVVQPVMVIPGQGEATPVEIDCMAEIDESRIRIGFRMPPGPGCHRLSGIHLTETAAAVAVRAVVEAFEDPLAGACPDEPIRVVTEVELQAPVGDRALLDGSR
ncbi:MAG: hypothetical protein ACR2K4_09185 [Candidatus Limnocylindria bacterium]